MNEKKYKGYTLKVSLDKKCYRHLTFPGSFTLEDLAAMILDAFDFDNDHLHAFFMDGKPYSHNECYYCRYSDDPGPSTAEVRIESLSLTEKRKFLFVFDFGDDWRFTCEVKKITDTPEKMPYISNVVGEAPQQYPDYDDLDFEIISDNEDREDEISSYVPIEPELYKAAFAFKEAKPWTKLSETDAFAVKFSDGEIGYVIVSGSRKMSYGMLLFIGKDGISGINNIKINVDQTAIDEVVKFNFSIMQNCAALLLVCKSDIEPEYVAEVQSYAKENGISLRGKNSFPYFLRYLPQRPPWSVGSEKERKYLRQALEAATELAKRLENCEKSEFRFGELPIIPMLSKKKNGYTCGSTLLPDPVPKKYEPLISQIQFKKFKKKIEPECRIINIPAPIYNPELGCSEYPVAAILATPKDEITEDDIIVTDPISHTADISEEMLSSITERLAENKVTPKTIKVSDERTKALLSDICERCGVKLIVEEALPGLDGIITNLLGCMISEILLRTEQQ